MTGQNLEQKIKNAIHESINYVFDASFQLLPKPIENDVNFEEKKTILSSIEFVGALEGALALVLSKEDACKIVSLMLGSEVKPDSPDVTDGIGEIINIISGQLIYFLDKYFSLTISIPVAITGNHLEYFGPEKSERITLNYVFDDMYFSVIVLYKEHEEL